MHCRHLKILQKTDRLTLSVSLLFIRCVSGDQFPPVQTVRKPSSVLIFNRRTCGGKFMQSATQAAPVSKKMLWAGGIISALPVLLMVFAGAFGVLKPSIVASGFV